jgi:hypothetical protein
MLPAHFFTLPLACAELDFPDKFSREQNTGKLDVAPHTKLELSNIISSIWRVCNKKNRHSSH